MIDVSTYLQRMNFHGSTAPTVDTLRALHRAHLLAIPFENLDIHRNKPIVLDEAALFEKIVTHRRGGYCYELNGLLASLLRALGFDVTLFSSNVIHGGIPAEIDHLTLLIQLNERWVVDVGFGDSSRLPCMPYWHNPNSFSGVSLVRQIYNTIRVICSEPKRPLLNSITLFPSICIWPSPNRSWVTTTFLLLQRLWKR